MLLLGCVAPPATTDSSDRPGPDDTGLEDASGQDTGPPADTGQPGDTAAEEAEGTTESIGDQDTDLDGWIFADDAVHQIDITLDAAAISALGADPYTWVPGSFLLDGEALDPVGVRLRGKIGSFRTLDGKPKFAIDFNQYVEDQRFFGLESLNLNNSVVDCSYLKEPLGYRIFQLAGVPAQRYGFAWVRVNGADYGLYVLVESPDDRMLRRIYPDPSGNLYDGKYVWYGGWHYTLLDFASGVDELYQLEEGTDVAHADIRAVSEAVAKHAGGGFKAGTMPVLDWEQYHRELAVEQWIGHNDGYALNTNNYRVYFDPTDGRAEIIPWDLDYAFLYDSDWGMSWSYPRGTLARYCWYDEACVRDQRAAVSEVVDAIDPEALAAWFEGVHELTSEYAQADPRRECGAVTVNQWRTYLRSWITTENDVLRAWWGL